MPEKSSVAPHPIPNGPQNLQVGAPVVNAPTTGASYSNPVTFNGTGLPGWWVYFTRTPIDGDSFGGVRVKDDGSWEFTAYLDPGEVAVFGWQQDDRVRSEWTPVIRFTVK